MAPKTCPKRILESNPQEYRAVAQAIEAWRHWKTGNLSAYCDPSWSLLRLILWVDDEVSLWESEQVKAATGGGKSTKATQQPLRPLRPKKKGVKR